jgi:hypothetical protein
MEDTMNHETRVPEQSSDNLSPEAHPEAEEALMWSRTEAKADRAAQKARVAAKARERTARLRALGLNARGKPLKDRHKNRNVTKQLQYQANFNARHKAARERLGMTIAEFNKLPRERRAMEYNKLKGKPVFTVKGALAKDRAERGRQRRREWYHRSKAKSGVSQLASTIRADIDSREAARSGATEHMSECPVCGCNLDKIRAIRLAVKFEEARKHGVQ